MDKMSHLRNPDCLRLQLEAVESPTTFPMSPDSSTAAFSPMTDLSFNLSDTTLDSTPRRRPALSGYDKTPVRGQLDFSDSPGPNSESPALGNRLLKDSIKLPSAGLCRVRSLSRRLLIQQSSSPYTNNKENIGSENDPAVSPSKLAVSPMRHRQPLEDQDPNSQDSGYGVHGEDAKTEVKFAEPFGVAPKRHLSLEQSPRKDKSGSSKVSLFHSLSSGSESFDDGFSDFLEIDKLDENTQVPLGLNSLLSGTIKSSGCLRPKAPLLRSQSLIEGQIPSSSKGLSLIFEQDELRGKEKLQSFKRPEPPCELVPSCVKRRKPSSLHSIQELSPPAPPIRFQRSFSESEATIKSALQRSTQIPDLIGDFSKPFILPLMEGRHQDLKSISADTLAALMEGEFSKEVESYTIIDCRYPYEYEGGHIKGAKNVYTKEQILKEFVSLKEPISKGENGKRNILIFHCEFSSERGPNLFRFLRNCDRDQNKECYPSLNYPELYLLDGGYKKFFELHSEKCEPCSYRPMLDPNHEIDLRMFRSKSRSWNGDSKSRHALRSSLKRLGL